ncbi:MAG: hypothetical protein ACLTYN_03775 [Dysosmobacter welbionis]
MVFCLLLGRMPVGWTAALSMLARLCCWRATPTAVCWPWMCMHAPSPDGTPLENGWQRGSGAVRGVAGHGYLILALVLCGMTAWGGGLGPGGIWRCPAAGGLYAALGPGTAVDLCP